MCYLYEGGYVSCTGNRDDACTSFLNVVYVRYLTTVHTPACIVVVDRHSLSMCSVVYHYTFIVRSTCTAGAK